MTPETLLMSAIGALTAALSFVCRLLWTKVAECEVDRKGLYLEIDKIRQEQAEFLKVKTEVLAAALINNTLALQANTTKLNELGHSK